MPLFYSIILNLVSFTLSLIFCGVVIDLLENVSFQERGRLPLKLRSQFLISVLQIMEIATLDYFKII